MSPALLTSLALALLAAEASPRQLDAIDEAHSCFRRQNHPCTLTLTETLLADADLPAALRRDALALRGQSLAQEGDAAGATALFEVLIQAGSAWRPERDAPAPIRAAFLEAYRRTRADSSGPVDPDPPPSTPLIPLSSFFASAGAGVAIPVGASARRYDPGLQAILEIGWRPSIPEGAAPAFGIVMHLSLAFLPLSDAIIAEPGQSTTLEVFSLAVAGDLRLRLAPSWHLVAQAGLGTGSFAIGASSSGPALALHGSLGVLWQLEDAFGLRLDLTPTLLLPFSDRANIGGHPAFTLRAEGSF